MRVTITNVYYFSGTKLNMVSWSRLDERGISTKIEQGTCILLDRSGNKIFAKVKRRESDGLFTARLITRSASDSKNIGRTKNAKQLIKDQPDSSRDTNSFWHQRLAFANDKTLRDMLSSKQYKMAIGDKPCTLEYTTCVLTKHIISSCKDKLIIW